MHPAAEGKEGYKNPLCAALSPFMYSTTCSLALYVFGLLCVCAYKGPSSYDVVVLLWL